MRAEANAAVPSFASRRIERIVLHVLQAGAVAVVLAALPYKLFDLDRHLVPKELVLHVTAVAAALLLLSRARSVSLSRVDTLLVGYLVLSVISALAAPNLWLATRALAVSLSAAALFWASREVARAGGRRLLVASFAAASVIGALTALLQAYGVESELVSLNRVPGGTFGNRNFMAHVAVIGAPALLLSTVEARTRVGFVLGTVGVAISSAAIALSRTRAAWLALIVCAVVIAVAMLGARDLWREWLRRRRALRTLAVAGGAAVAATLLPNTLNWKSASPYLDSVRGVVNFREGSGQGRLVQYRTTARMAAAHPVFGAGVGNWAVEYPRLAARGDPSLDDETRMTSNPWPSSDWMAFLSERGAPAFFLLALTLLGLVITALRDWRSPFDPYESLGRVTLVATVAATVVVGSLDAVLLLAAPSFIGWSILGALAPPTRPKLSRPLSERKRRATLGIVGLAGLFVLVRSGSQIAAMSMFSSANTIAALERASLMDPGSYRIHIRTAETAARRGRCARVRAHARAARDLFPSAPAPRRLLRSCGGR